MNQTDFESYLIKLGFVEEITKGRFEKDKIIIENWRNVYNIYNGYTWSGYFNINDLKPLRKFERSYKLKQILN